ncbi:MAG: hypothetical protein JSV83_21705, partial [Desulfobacterales bacterium]
YTASDGITASDPATVTVTVTPGIHVADLEGNTATAGKKKWKARVIITVHSSDDSSVADATVNGSWSGSISYPDSCITDVNGQCEITSRPMLNSDKLITFDVDIVNHLTLRYQPEDNHISSISINLP